LANSGKLVAQRDTAGSPGLASETFAQGDDDRLGQRLSGPFRQCAGKSISLGILDTQRHV
jgi:hypothetical protein